MDKFKFDVNYNQKQIYILKDVIGSLPGIKTYSSGFSNDHVDIWFHVHKNENKGLFFLTRCSDRRYGGMPWKIDLSVGDVYEYDGEYPITYCLNCYDGNINDNIDSLLDNLEHHLNHMNFMKGYDLSINDFKTITLREQKLKRILI